MLSGFKLPVNTALGRDVLQGVLESDVCIAQLILPWCLWKDNPFTDSQHWLEQ